jgi:hypothetical protein
VSGPARLKRIQERLEARGCVDVKFAWGATQDKPLSQVASEVADVLEAYLDGKTVPMRPFNDSPRRKGHAWRRDDPFYICDKCGAVSSVADDSGCRLA